MSAKRSSDGPAAGKAKSKRRKASAKAAVPASAKRVKSAAAAKPVATKVRAARETKKTVPAKVVRAKSSKAAQAPARSARRAPGKTSKAKSGVSLARFTVGDVVRHKFYPFRGVIFDIDPVFANSEEWWLSIPEQMRPKKNQPFYHLLAENAETEYIAYVSEQNLLPDTTGVPVRHPQVAEYFEEDDDGRYRPVFMGMLN